MKTQFQPTKLFVSIGLLALILIAYAALDSEKPQAAASPERSSYALPISRDASYAVVALPDRLTKAYLSPDIDSTVVDLYTPSLKALQIIGRSEGGDWVMVTRSGEGEAASGWIPTGELRIQGSIWPLPVVSNPQNTSASAADDTPTAFLNQLTKVYRGPGLEHEVANVFTPSQTPIQLVGRSQDGAWLVIQDAAGSNVSEGWVPAGEVEVQGNVESLPVVTSSATTAVLTKVYAGPEYNAAIVDILMPQTEVQVIGRSPDVKWLVISNSSDDDDASRWIQVGETKLDGEVEELQVISD